MLGDMILDPTEMSGRHEYQLSWIGSVLRQLGLRRGHRTCARILRKAFRVPGSFMYRDFDGLLHIAEAADDMHLLGLFGFHRMKPAITAFVPCRGTIVDVGANVGLTAAQLYICSGGAPMVCIEPLSSNVKALRDLVAINGWTNVRVIEAAAGRSPGFVHLLLPVSGNSGWASVVKTWDTLGQVTVSQFPLDQLLTGYDVSFVKIDVEGYEEEVLAGMTQILTDHRPSLLIERNTPLLAAAGSSPESINKLLESFGYRLKLIERVSSVMDDALYVWDP